MLHLIINPIAGNRRAEKIGYELVESLKKRGFGYSFTRTECTGHATRIARAAAEQGADTVIAVGGDGTVSEVVRGLSGTRAVLGIIPAGTGNDVAKMLGIPKKPLEALDFMLSKPARPVDFGTVNGRAFMNACGTGFDVSTIDQAHVAKRYVRGMLPYLWGVIRTIFIYKPVVARLEIDGGAPEMLSLLLLAVANGRFEGGGMEVAPHSKPDDGLFDLVTVDSMPNWKVLPNLIRLLSGRVMEVPGTTVRRCRRAVLSAENLRINIDGEVEPTNGVAVFEIQPGAMLAHW